jgi:hypothetical protein
VSLADAHRWVGGLHPLGALVVLTMAARIAWDSPVGSLRRSAGAATGAGTL